MRRLLLLAGLGVTAGISPAALGQDPPPAGSARPAGPGLTGAPKPNMAAPAPSMTPTAPPPSGAPSASIPAPIVPCVKPPVIAPVVARPAAVFRPPQHTANPSLPAPDVRVWLGAPSPTGLWTLRVDNEGTRPARIPADVRTLHIEVTENEGRRSRTYKCDLPTALRPQDFPDRRALLLPPGDSYVESFDPHLFCFGKNAAALRGGNTVRAYFGWSERGGRVGRFGPWAVEPTDDPALFGSRRALDVPTGVLSFESDAAAGWTENQWIAPNAPPPPAPPPLLKKTEQREHTQDHFLPGREARIAAAAGNRRRWDQPVNIVYHPEPVPKAKPKPEMTEEELKKQVIDENAPRFDLTVDRFIDASAPDRIPMTFKATNVGKRPMLVVLRPRMLGLNVDGPDGLKRCESGSSTGAVPRDEFRTVLPDQTVTMTLWLAEICPIDVFSRPGLYKIQATLDANESGQSLGLSAYVGSSISEHGWLRLATAPDPFYATAPRAIQTDRLLDEKAKE